VVRENGSGGRTDVENVFEYGLVVGMLELRAPDCWARDERVEVKGVEGRVEGGTERGAEGRRGRGAGGRGAERRSGGGMEGWRDGLKGGKEGKDGQDENKEDEDKDWREIRKTH
jgi:hypothetical protein